MDFEQTHEAWIQDHLSRRSGERRGRLEREHRHRERLFARNVWWEVFGHFEHLHPEFELADWRGRSYFADFAWITRFIRLLIEIKGFSAHVLDMDRQRYSHELNRETFWTGLGYRVISFAYDDVEQRPEVCISLLRMVMSQFQPQEAPVARALFAEKEVIRLALQSTEPLRPKDVAEHFDINTKTAIAILRRLTDKRWMTPVLRGNGERMVRYELTPHASVYVE